MDVTRPGVQRFTAAKGSIGIEGNAKRVYRVEFGALGTDNQISLYNGIADSSTANRYVITAVATANSGNYWESHAGLRFPAGCYLAMANSSLAYAVVSYIEEF